MIGAENISRVKFYTDVDGIGGSGGVFVVEVRRQWAPIGADHFLKLVKAHFYSSK